MEVMKAIDKTLEELYIKGPQTSIEVRKYLAKIAVWASLILGAFSVIMAFGILDLVKATSSLCDAFNRQFVDSCGVNIMSNTTRLFIYISFATMLISGVFSVIAYPKLRDGLAAGWRLLFVGTILGVAYSVFQLFITGRGVPSFVGGIISAAISFWFLYQIKSQFVKEGQKTAGAATPKTTKK
jgi:hypothetical protein